MNPMPPSLNSFAERAAQLAVEAQAHALARTAEAHSLLMAQDEVQDVLTAQKALQTVAQSVQQQAHERIAGVVTRCLAAVFVEDPYEFKILFEQKRGRTEARLVFSRNDENIDPLTAAGGGVVDVASFALRLSCLMLSQPPVRRLLVLDEPFKNLSEQYRERVRTLLEMLSEELKLQILMVTHIDELRCGKIVEL